jgi:hypothetical protein
MNPASQPTLAVILALAVAFASRYPKASALGLSTAAKRRTALPKAGAKAQPQRLIYRLCLCFCLLLPTHFHSQILDKPDNLKFRRKPGQEPGLRI